MLQAFSPEVYGPGASFGIFTTAVVGGLGSLLGAALGALYLQGGQWFLPGPQWQQLASAAGVLIVLLIIPGGLGDLVHRIRDGWLRWVTRRHDIIWPKPDYNGVDDATEVWWNPAISGKDEIEREGKGLYEFVDGGKRYLPRQWTTAPTKAFKMAGAVAVYAKVPPSEQVPTYPSPAPGN